MSDARGAASWDAERPPRCTCTEDESSDGSATYEDDPHCQIHGWCSWRAENKRLREQRDAARQALREIAEHDGHTAFEYCVPMMVEAARAALGVEGEANDE